MQHIQLFHRASREPIRPITSSQGQTEAEYFEALRKMEYGRLDREGLVYLDYTGEQLYPDLLLDQHRYLLEQKVWGNPHSINPSSMTSNQHLDDCRTKVLEFFNASDQYECVFTSNATAALKLVGESYPFDGQAQLLLTMDNHNSVNGIREFCRMKKGSFSYVPMVQPEMRIDEGALMMALMEEHQGNKLFAFPAQSNVTGVKHDLDWVTVAQQQGWEVLLDAAAFVPTNALDLSQVQADFVALSFYKMFGYPTGIGALLVRKDKIRRLKKVWFAGGTVDLAAVLSPHHVLTQGPEQFEDGTVDFLGIPAVSLGLSYLKSVGMARINKRVTHLTAMLLAELKSLKHHNGRQLIQLIGPENIRERGGTLLMNFYDMDNRLYDPAVIEREAAEFRISLRTGCFCNPGIDELHSGMEAKNLSAYFTHRVAGNYEEMIRFLGQLRGGVRVSLGFVTNDRDISRFIAFCKTFLNTRC